jgi:hypothetical protein
LDIVSQAIGFLYGIIGMSFGVLVGQKRLTLQWANVFQELGFKSPPSSYNFKNARLGDWKKNCDHINFE